MRAAIHGLIRDWFPDNPRPSGAGWLVAPAPVDCLKCGTATLVMVKLPSVDATIAYCQSCGATGELLISGEW